MAVIEDRKRAPSKNSYTVWLFDGGVDRIGEKIVEEAAEAVEAADLAMDEAGRQHLAHEAADLIYHLFVLLVYRDVSLGEVADQLSKTCGISGLDEKASRGFVDRVNRA